MISLKREREAEVDDDDNEDGGKLVYLRMSYVWLAGNVANLSATISKIKLFSILLRVSQVTHEHVNMYLCTFKLLSRVISIQ